MTTEDDQSHHAPFTSDEPVVLDQDAFGHRDYARALADIVNDDEPPLTIGVFGSWGVGKSTIVAGLKEELGPDIAFAYFDAWRYEDDSLRRQFLRDVGGDLKRDESLDLGQFDPDRDLTELDVDEQRTEEAFSLSWPRLKRALLVGVFIGVIAFALIQLAVVADFVTEDKFGKQFAPAAAAGLVAFLAGIFSQWIHVTQRVITAKSLSDPDRFQVKFLDLIKATKPDRIVVAIDNLDRASPEKAVEMLSTIKTYLEPAVSPPTSNRPKLFSRDDPAAKQVIFVVSVDDAALRRHLLAQELTRSTEAGAVEARRYVDEYLAKFFNVRLPIRPILADDTRAYVGQHLASLIASRDYKAEETQLVSLVSTALRRNPRRIKQFVNDLEARLRLLEEREKTPPDGQPGIAAPVSRDILMVSKLALVEAEWPDAFERLQREPKRLAEWHQAAEESDEVYWEESDDSGPTESPSYEDRETARGFAAFLRASRPINSVHLRALIDLREAPAEAGLTGFAEFREAVISGERSEAQRLVEAAPEGDKHRYADRLSSVLADQIEHGDFDAARAVVDAALSVDALSAFTAERTKVLSEALQSAKLRSQLGQLDPGRLVTAGRPLPQAKRDVLHGAVVARMLDETESLRSQARAAAALATIAGDLNDPLRAQIRSGIDTDALRSQFTIYADLVEADPRVLPSGVATSALEGLLPTPERPDKSLSWDGEEDPQAEAAYRVLVASVRDGIPPDLEPQLFDHIVSALDVVQGDPVRLGRALPRISKFVQALNRVDSPQAGRLAEHIRQQWASYPIEMRPSVIELLGEVLDRASQDVRAAVAAQVLDQLFEDPGTGVAFVAEHGVPEAFGDLATDRLASLLSQPSYREVAADALEALSTPDLGRRLSDGAIASVQAGDFDGATWLIDRYPKQLQQHGVELASHVLNRTQEVIDAGGSPPFTVLARLVPWMGASERTRFADLISVQFATARPEAVEAVGALARAENGAEILDRVIEAALANLESMPQIPSSHMPLLDLVVDHSDRLTSNQVDGLLTRLEVWLQEQPEERVALSNRTARLSNMTAMQRERLVRYLIAAERKEDPSSSVRFELLRSAHSVKGRANSRASSAFNSRVDELASSGADDQVLAEQLRDLEP